MSSLLLFQWGARGRLCLCRCRPWSLKSTFRTPHLFLLYPLTFPRSPHFGLDSARHAHTCPAAGRGQTQSPPALDPRATTSSPLARQPCLILTLPPREGHLCTGPQHLAPVLCTPSCPCWASPKGSEQTAQASRPVVCASPSLSSCPPTLLCPGTRGTLAPPDRPPQHRVAHGPAAHAVLITAPAVPGKSLRRSHGASLCQGRSRVPVGGIPSP